MGFVSLSRGDEDSRKCSILHRHHHWGLWSSLLLSCGDDIVGKMDDLLWGATIGGGSWVETGAKLLDTGLNNKASSRSCLSRGHRGSGSSLMMMRLGQGPPRLSVIAITLVISLIIIVWEKLVIQTGEEIFYLHGIDYEVLSSLCDNCCCLAVDVISSFSVDLVIKLVLSSANEFLIKILPWIWTYEFGSEALRTGVNGCRLGSLLWGKIRLGKHLLLAVNGTHPYSNLFQVRNTFYNIID